LLWQLFDGLLQKLKEAGITRGYVRLLDDALWANAAE
jgi:hypothetical protein